MDHAVNKPCKWGRWICRGCEAPRYPAPDYLRRGVRSKRQRSKRALFDSDAFESWSRIELGLGISLRIRASDWPGAEGAGFRYDAWGWGGPRPRTQERTHLRIHGGRSAPRRNDGRKHDEVRTGATRRWRHKALRDE